MVYLSALQKKESEQSEILEYREIFHDAWRFYRSMRGPNPMVRKGEEPIMKNQRCEPVYVG